MKAKNKVSNSGYPILGAVLFAKSSIIRCARLISKLHTWNFPLFRFKTNYGAYTWVPDRMHAVCQAQACKLSVYTVQLEKIALANSLHQIRLLPQNYIHRQRMRCDAQIN